MWIPRCCSRRRMGSPGSLVSCRIWEWGKPGRWGALLTLSPIQAGKASVQNAFETFTERWSWGVRALVQAGNEIAKTLGLAGRYHIMVEKFSDTVCRGVRCFGSCVGRGRSSVLVRLVASVRCCLFRVVGWGSGLGRGVSLSPMRAGARALTTTLAVFRVSCLDFRSRCVRPRCHRRSRRSCPHPLRPRCMR